MAVDTYVIQRVINLLEEKKDYFTLYEQVSLAMLSCDADELEEKIGRRAVIIERIDHLDACIDEACEKQQLYCQAARASCGRSELPEGWKTVFDCAMQVRAIIGRLPDIDLQIEMRLEQERDLALEQIKSNNRGQNAQAAKYYSAMVGGSVPRSGRFGSA